MCLHEMEQDGRLHQSQRFHAGVNRHLHPNYPPRKKKRERKKISQYCLCCTLNSNVKQPPPPPHGPPTPGWWPCISILALCKHFWRGTWRCWHAWTSWRGWGVGGGGEVLLGSDSKLLFARSQLPRRWLPLPRLAPDSGRTSSARHRCCRRRRPRLPCKRQTHRQNLLVSEGAGGAVGGEGGLQAKVPPHLPYQRDGRILKPACAHLLHGKQISGPNKPPSDPDFWLLRGADTQRRQHAKR